MIKGEVTGAVTREKFMHTVFRNKHRIDIWHAVMQYSIDPPEEFQQRDLSHHLEIPISTVYSEFSNLRALGAVQLTPTGSKIGGFNKTFVRVASPVWDVVAAAFEASSHLPR